MSEKEPQRKPVIYDVTLRDGNQALKKPWNLEEKTMVFKQLVNLGLDGAEVGFAAASETDFASCRHLASMAPENMIISSLSRANKAEIEKSWQAIKVASRPRIHIVLPVSRYAVKNILQKSQKEVRKMAFESVDLARHLKRNRGEVQFSRDHSAACIGHVDNKFKGTGIGSCSQRPGNGHGQHR